MPTIFRMLKMEYIQYERVKYGAKEKKKDLWERLGSYIGSITNRVRGVLDGSCMVWEEEVGSFVREVVEIGG